VDQMYCNYCGHFICKTCLNDPKFAFICKSVGCNQPILRDNRSGVSIVNKENVGSSPSPSPQITEKHYSSALPRSPRQFDNVQLNVPPSTVNNRYLSPNVPSNVRADNIMKTP
jgi:hypothetical protein